MGAARLSALALCAAYCEVLDCDGPAPRAAARACEQLATRFDRAADGPLPCTIPDLDGDAVSDELDNCVAVANPEQLDADADALGDACDDCPSEANPGPLVEQVQIAGGGATGVTGAFTVSDTGVLAFQTASTVRSQLTWLDRGGREIARLGDAADYVDVALSPDETRAAVSVMDPGLGTRDLWLFDLARGLPERFTFDPGEDFAPVWLKPNGDQLVFSSQRQGGFQLYQKPVRGAGADTLLFEDRLGKFAAHASPDGRFILYIGGGGQIQRSDVWVLPLAGDRKAYPLLQTPFVESQPQFSPDGRWIAYMTNESGRQEVYVRPFAGADDKWRVSSTGGGWPRWRRDGKEIFYLAPDGALTAVPVNGQGARFEVGAGRPLFSVRTRPQSRLDAYNYDVTADGRRFLINTLVDQPTQGAITLVVNWPAALKK